MRIPVKPKIYIDGQSGTTGLQIYERIGKRADLELLRIDEEKRHDSGERRKLIAAADIVFLCLPDAAAVEAVSLAEGTDTRIIDASTAHRTAPGWIYGFPELGKERREQIANGNRVANPGCHASGFLAAVAPLVELGVLPKDYPVVCYSLTGYSGGGKKMIAQYEAEERDAELSAPRLYGLGLQHKHLREMQAVSGLTRTPAFVPVVDDYYKGMATSVLLHSDLLKGNPGADGVRDLLSGYYRDAKVVSVAEKDSQGDMIAANRLAGTDRMEIIVCGNSDQILITSLFDNLGKGASGAAVQNMNLMLGLEETTGLVLR